MDFWKHNCIHFIRMGFVITIVINYCCVTKYHKHSRLKQWTVIILQFFFFLVQEPSHILAGCLLLRVSHKAALKCQLGLESSKSWLSPSLFKWSWKGFNSLKIIVLRVSGPWWVLARGPPQFFAMCISPYCISKHGSWLPLEKVRTGKRERQKSQSLYNPISQVTSFTLPYSTH